MGDEAGAAGAPCLFERTCLVSADSVRLSARCALGQRQLIALVMQSGDLMLYYRRGQPGELPVMKHVPWFGDGNKKIVALCFDPPGNWLLVVAYDGSIFVVPALCVVDPGAPPDHRWSMDDVTAFPGAVAGRGRPTAVAWWQGVREPRHVAVVGTDQGELCFFSLAAGVSAGDTRVTAPIEALHVCGDNGLDSVFLLITGRQRCQWRLLLEQGAADYCWLLDVSPAATLESSADLEGAKNSGNPHLPTARSRLQGLKQLSVEKLAHLKLKLAETRLRSTNNFHIREPGAAEVRDEGEAVEPAVHPPGSGPLPERVSTHVGDVFLWPQYARDRYLLSGYHAPSSILTIHSMSMDVVPLFVYKLPPDCRDVLVTDRFLFVTDEDERNVLVVSCHFAESRLDCDIDYNMDSVVGTFELGTGERVLALYRQGGAARPRQNPAVREAPGAEGRSRGHKRSSLQFIAPPSGDVVDTVNTVVESPPVDSCVLVTTAGIYQLALRRPAAQVFTELVLQRQQLETAERVALMFGLPLQELLERAGDAKLATRDFPQAIALYKLSRCSHLKSVLKFAAGGHSAELLGFITCLFSTAGLDLTTAERIHLSNLAVMSHTEQLLRTTASKATPFKQFVKFLRDNPWYDEVLAVNVAGQTGLWEVLQFLASHRGLHQEVLEVTSSVVATLLEGAGRPAPTAATTATTGALLRPASLLDAGLWMCVSDPTLLPAFLARPQHCKVHLQFVTACLPRLEPFALQRLAALYDPSSPLLRPGLRGLLGRDSGSPGQSLDCSDEGSGAVPLEEVLQQFVLVLLHLAAKTVGLRAFHPGLVPDVRPPDLGVQDVDDLTPNPVPVQTTSLSAGFAHVALVRNGTALTWGSTAQGCLGTGPTLSQYSGVQPITFFPSLKLEVLSISCGRLHTVALTDNGVFTWGSSQYGQLGVGRTGRSSRPRLVEALCRERVVAVATGQYHSLALTGDGRVYSWGWGVHGQLGHGSVEDLHVPALVRALSGKVVVQVCGGYAHSLALTADGRVFSFGSSMFGQLGHGCTGKSSVPVQVAALPEGIRNIATSYFHNLAVSVSNKLYVWGSSPQVLRVQAQAQKKARLLHHQLLHGSEPAGLESPSRSRPRLASDDEHFSSAINYSDSDFEDIADSPRGENAAAVRTHPSPSESGEPEVCLDPAGLLVDNRSLTKKPAAVCPPQRISGGNGMPRSSALEGLKGTGKNNVHLNAVLSGVVSREDLVIQSVVSPTMEFKGLTTTPVSLHAGNAHSKTSDGGAHQGQPDSPEDGQSHLLPQLVDTSLVTGRIVQVVCRQVACGCHHSALLSEGDGLYVWGRNLDGQLGNGTCKEVPLPTPLSSALAHAPLPPARTRGGGKLHVPVVMPGGERLRARQVACGCEFTVALDGSGKVWAWGSNAGGQLGKPPNEESRALEGKLFMLKSAKRVIKLPHGSGNSSNTPREVPGVPSSTISFKHGASPGQTQGLELVDVCPPLSTLEKPSYGLLTLHYVMQRFHGFYDSGLVMSKSLELENYQAAAKLAALDRNYPLALSYQLKALALAVPESVLHSSQGLGQGKSPVTDSQNGVRLVNSGILPEQTNGISDALANNSLLEAKGNDNTERVSEIRLSAELLAKVKDSDSASRLNSSDQSDDIEKYSHDVEYISEKNAVPGGSPVGYMNGLESRAREPAKERREGEIHAFAVEGGKEQMFEAGQCPSSPDSASSLANTPEASRLPGESPALARDITLSRLSLRLDLQSPCAQVPTPSLPTLTTPSSWAESPRGPGGLPGGTTPAQFVMTSYRDLMQQASVIVEYYVSVMEEDSHAMMNKLLHKGIEFWLQHSLPMDSLENLLLKHMSKFFYPLGLLMFCQRPGCRDRTDDDGDDRTSAVLASLSTKFSLQLCSVLLSHLQQRKQCPEYVEVLARCAAGGTGSCAAGEKSQEQMMEEVFQNLGVHGRPGETPVQPCVRFKDMSVLKQGSGVHQSPEQLYVFSCGHHYSADGLKRELDAGLRGLTQPLPNTARMLQEVFSMDAPSLHLACPSCVLAFLQQQAVPAP
ncbi:uncharacterized protein LOC134527844 isoform X2 [Bacillus rossius redtenbacheri]|uniref:uncharacterized protein LOC134527844 isoform X2 n=1 Tax=Bacillus rossius redtenbacheri TaxID=93214 RepID=UPI002FDEF1EA